MLITFFVFHFEISGDVFNDIHPQNIKLISITFSVFHFEISGKDSNDEKTLLKYKKELILLIFCLEKKLLSI